MTKAAGTIASLFAGLLPPSLLSSMPLSEIAYATDEKIYRKVDYLLHSVYLSGLHLHWSTMIEFENLF
jgi:hypothetical protein